MGRDGSGDAAGFIGGAQIECQAWCIALARQVERKIGDFAGEHRNAAARCDAESVQVAEGMHHADEREAGEQEDEGMAERQVVVDGTGQHGQQGGGKEQAGPRRQDEDAPLRQA